jgi:hypothetical protein
VCSSDLDDAVAADDGEEDAEPADEGDGVNDEAAEGDEEADVEPDDVIE